MDETDLLSPSKNSQIAESLSRRDHRAGYVAFAKAAYAKPIAASKASSVDVATDEIAATEAAHKAASNPDVEFAAARGALAATVADAKKPESLAKSPEFKSDHELEKKKLVRYLVNQRAARARWAKVEAKNEAFLEAKFAVGSSEMPDIGSKKDKWMKYYEVMHYTQGFGIKWAPDNNPKAPILPFKFTEDDNVTVSPLVNEMIRKCIDSYNASHVEEKYAYYGRKVKNVAFIPAHTSYTRYYITFTASQVGHSSIEKSFVGHCRVYEPPPFHVCCKPPFPSLSFRLDADMKEEINKMVEEEEAKKRKGKGGDGACKGGGKVKVDVIFCKLGDGEPDFKLDEPCYLFCCMLYHEYRETLDFKTFKEYINKGWKKEALPTYPLQELMPSA